MASFWFTLAVVVACILTVDATRMIHKPARHNRIAKRAATGKTQFGYYINQGDGSAYNYSQSYGVCTLCACG